MMNILVEMICFQVILATVLFVFSLGCGGFVLLVNKTSTSFKLVLVYVLLANIAVYLETFVLAFWKEDLQNWMNTECCLVIAHFPVNWMGQLFGNSVLTALLDTVFDNKMSTLVLSFLPVITAAFSFVVTGIAQPSMLCRDEFVKYVTLHHRMILPEEMPEINKIPNQLPTFISIVVSIIVLATKSFKSQAKCLASMPAWSLVCLVALALVLMQDVTNKDTSEDQDDMRTCFVFLIGMWFIFPMFAMKKLFHQMSSQEPASDPSPV